MSDRNEAGVAGHSSVTRREFLRAAAIAGASVGLGGLAWGCGDTEDSTSSIEVAPTTSAVQTTTAPAAVATSVDAGVTGGRVVKVGLTMPKTGAYAAFAEPMEFLISQFSELTASGIVMGDGLNHPVELRVADTQSDGSRAAQVAGDLINNDKVDLMMSGGGPEVVLPVADQCEALGVPSLSTNTPWEPWVFSRNGAMDRPFAWTYLACGGITEFIQADVHTIGLLPTNKNVALLLANTADGQAWADPNTGFPPALEAAGFEVTMPGLYPPGIEDFTSQISSFKKAGCEICMGSPSVPDLTNFWRQSLQQGYHPVILLMGLPLMFPAAPTAIGSSIYNASCEVNWHPKWPFRSTLTGQTGQELADEYEAKTGLQWSMVLGSNHHAFEWTVDVLKRTTSIDDKATIVEAIKSTKLTSVNGHYDLTAPLDPGPGEKHPHPNVATMGMGSGQWVKGTKWPFEVVQVGCIMPELEVASTATMQAMQYS